MANLPDKQTLQAAAIEEIRDALYEPRTTLARVRRRVGQILMKLRADTREAAPAVISTREKMTLFNSVRKARRRR